jgi:hypothetical protein
MRRGTSWWATAGGAALLLALTAPWSTGGCSHRWDDYEWLPGGDGGSGGAPSQQCAAVCAGYELCAGAAWATCLAECATCSLGELATIGACVDALSSSCPGAVVAFRACVNNSTACMDVP